VEATAAAQREAAAVEAAGHTQMAEIIRSTPVPVIAEQARPVVYAKAAPKVEGMRESGTWKVEVENAGLVPLFFADRVRQAINDATNLAIERKKVLDQADMQRLTTTIAGIFADFYSLDDVKVNGYLKPKKELAINLVPGIKVWFAPKTSTTGRS
jgi:hypothetical protein